VKQSASEILKQADRMIALSQSVHDAVAAVPLDEVSLSLSLIFHLSKNSLGLFFGVFSTETTGAEKIQVCVHK
jgi:hypothetical protein